VMLMQVNDELGWVLLCSTFHSMNQRYQQHLKNLIHCIHQQRVHIDYQLINCKPTTSLTQSCGCLLCVTCCHIKHINNIEKTI
jgi:Uri superfamily endonuclease